MKHITVRLPAVCACSDGRDYPFLAKPKDDLRKDYRLMDFAGELQMRQLYAVGTFAHFVVSHEAHRKLRLQTVMDFAGATLV
jgi:hypothetical protein